MTQETPVILTGEVGQAHSMSALLRASPANPFRCHAFSLESARRWRETPPHHGVAYMKTKKASFLRVFVCVFLSAAMGALSGERNPTCAVIDFQALDGMTEGQAKVLSERIFFEVSRLDQFTMVERAEAEKVLKENKFSLDCSDTECAVEAGKLLSANFIIIGSVAKFGQLYTINARLVDVETGAVKTQAATDHRGQLDELLTMASPQVARQLAGLPAERETRSPMPSGPMVETVTLNAAPPPAQVPPTRASDPSGAILVGVLVAGAAVAGVAALAVASGAGQHCDDDHPLSCPNVKKCCPAGYPYHASDGQCYSRPVANQDDVCVRE